MKIKNKLIDFGNCLGYGFAIGLVVSNLYLFYLINRDERVKVLREPNKLMWVIEVLSFCGIGAFLVYKLFKTFRDRYNPKRL